MGISPSITEMKANRSAIDSITETPAVIVTVTNAVPVGYRPRVIVIPVPGMVIISGTIHNNAMIDITSGVSGSIPDINDFRSGIINIKGL